MFGKISILVLALSVTSLVSAKTPKYPAVADSQIVITGDFIKHDKAFVYLQVKGASNLVKIRPQYLPNSPLKYERMHRIEASMPLGRFLLDNPISKKSTNKKTL